MPASPESRSKRRASDATLAQYAALLLRQVAGPAPPTASLVNGLWTEVYRRADWQARWAELDTLPAESADFLRRSLSKMHTLGTWRRRRIQSSC